MILFINDLTVIDSSYLCAKRGMVGESWIVDLEIEGDLNAMSMVFDFARVKKQAKQLIDEVVDHKLLLPMKSEQLQLSQSADTCYVDFQYGDHSLHLSAPESAFAMLPSARITDASLIAFLKHQLIAVLPDNIAEVRLSLRYESIEGSYYHYSHGLKKHDGNCQRIAHGHRSKIQIFENGQRKTDLEATWSKRWADIYLGSQQDCVPNKNLNLSQSAISAIKDHQLFAYEALQGEFTLAIPANQTEILPCDTTVECLAMFIADSLKQQYPTSSFKVVAYEGVKKGAIASA